MPSQPPRNEDRSHALTRAGALAPSMASMARTGVERPRSGAGGVVEPARSRPALHSNSSRRACVLLHGPCALSFPHFLCSSEIPATRFGAVRRNAASYGNAPDCLGCHSAIAGDAERAEQMALKLTSTVGGDLPVRFRPRCSKSGHCPHGRSWSRQNTLAFDALGHGAATLYNASNEYLPAPVMYNNKKPPVMLRFL